MSVKPKGIKLSPKKEKVLTLCIVYKHPKVLLGYKKRGFGAKRWNGFGGKVKGGESVEEAARRELKEEAGLIVKDLEKAGELSFEFRSSGEELKVHVFRVSDFSGKERESKEMKPQWFFMDEIPFKEMWPDDPYWLPLFFTGRFFRGRFIFEDEEKLKEHSVEVCEDC
ncbi:MAG: nudix (nucleoside diphosphate linked moiety X)-type motif 1 [Parcubacteria group bacterium Gr01-1014_107]|nr:MAG: nudix (nucleoside diphosphate linked moiety X)-type motif 1 [Parcubacteria group bacterium Gr01-1014_107]